MSQTNNIFTSEIQNSVVHFVGVIFTWEIKKLCLEILSVKITDKKKEKRLCKVKVSQFCKNFAL